MTINFNVDLIVTKQVEEKLLAKFHPVTIIEVEEAISTFDGRMILDDRPNNKTNPPTYWFLAETFDGRLLKIVIKLDKKNKAAYLRTAYAPDEEEIIFYEDHCK